MSLSAPRSTSSALSNYSVREPAAELRNLDSAFPPFALGAQTKSVYERAGFDVNRGGHHSGRRKQNRSRASNHHSSSTSSKTSPASTFVSSFSSKTNSLRSNNHVLSTVSSATSNSFDFEDKTANKSSESHSYNMSNSESLPKIQVNNFGQYPTPPQSTTNLNFPDNQEFEMGQDHGAIATAIDSPATAKAYADDPYYHSNHQDLQPMHHLHSPRIDQFSEHQHNEEEAPSYRNSAASSIYSLDRDPVMQASPHVSVYPPKHNRNELHEPMPDYIDQDISDIEHALPEGHDDDMFPRSASGLSHISSSGTSNSLSSYHNNNDTTSSSMQEIPPISQDHIESFQFHKKNISQQSSLSSGSHSRSATESTTSPTTDYFACTAPLKPAKKTAKKICRGCNEPIVGKCVYSKDGRLSGKWHRQCFTCQSCHVSFDSEFYVFNDLPYCGPCYHVENNSICHGCGRGIEGECLETFATSNDTTRYHPGCLCCAECREPIHEEYYYTINGYMYCSQHAYHHQEIDEFGNPRMEKRRTRLMMI
ncbi:hypothetical protein TRVA0_001S00100 [Trichomonascus vanleenenianus]|uniref:Pxl1p n=1 Tax=Trichomonascus vanleenenianus TaxID=2268995 RepID=UPI003EC98A88